MVSMIYTHCSRLDALQTKSTEQENCVSFVRVCSLLPNCKYIYLECLVKSLDLSDDVREEVFTGKDRQNYVKNPQAKAPLKILQHMCFQHRRPRVVVVTLAKRAMTKMKSSKKISQQLAVEFVIH